MAQRAKPDLHPRLQEDVWAFGHHRLEDFQPCRHHQYFGKEGRKAHSAEAPVVGGAPYEKAAAAVALTWRVALREVPPDGSDVPGAPDAPPLLVPSVRAPLEAHALPARRTGHP
ncbi:MAG TPA: hypothetical protein DFR83_29145, partial [Deltaproteobacteria bacterium]|nr:hypothetical protein [Deltaproteobacteria bacterium]